jgi:DNA-binding GntR family transcriptional regulator
MNTRPKRRTLSEETYDTLRQQILGGQLAPGSRLVVPKLAKELEISATPINEALAALDRERLVSYSPRRGYSVSTVTHDMTEEIYTVREAVEALAVKVATTKADPALVQRLGAILKEAGVAVERGQADVFGTLDLAFHRTIWQATDSQLIERIAELVEGQIRLLVATGARAPGRMPVAHAEHKRIYKAIAAGKPENAETAVRAHIVSSKETLKRGVPAEREPGRINHASRVAPMEGGDTVGQVSAIARNRRTVGRRVAKK